MISTIVGKRGKGKTTLARELISSSNADQVFIYDYLGEYLSFSSERCFISRENISDFCKNTWNISSPEFQSLVVFDEIDLYGRNNEQIAYLYRYGRHKNLDTIAIARRFYDLPVITRALTDKFYLFQITEERDINYLRRYISNEFINKLIHLADYQYINIDF